MREDGGDALSFGDGDVVCLHSSLVVVEWRFESRLTMQLSVVVELTEMMSSNLLGINRCLRIPAASTAPQRNGIY